MISFKIVPIKISSHNSSSLLPILAVMAISVSANSGLICSNSYCWFHLFLRPYSHRARVACYNVNQAYHRAVLVLLFLRFAQVCSLTKSKLFSLFLVFVYKSNIFCLTDWQLLPIGSEINKMQPKVMGQDAKM